MSSSAKILVADDELIGRQLLEAILVPEGYDLTFATNGEETLAAVENETPDIILLDVMMPRLDGFEVCKILKNQKKTAHIPIYFITALDDRDSRLRGIDAGAYDYISKPFDRVEIMGKIKNAVQQLNIFKNSGRNLPQSAGFDGEMLSALALIIFEEKPDKKHLQVFRSLSGGKSRNALLRRESSSGIYTFMISNTLDEPHCLMANCILGSIFSKIMETPENEKVNTVDMALIELERIIKEKELSVLEKAGFSLLAVCQKKESGETACSGINQNIYILEQNSYYNTFTLDRNKSYRSSGIKGIIAFSPCVYGEFSQQALLDILNGRVKDSGTVDPGQLAKEKLSNFQDLLIMNISLR